MKRYSGYIMTPWGRVLSQYRGARHVSKKRARWIMKDLEIMSVVAAKRILFHWIVREDKS